MPRLFVSLPAPPVTGAALAELAGSVPESRPLSEAQFHVTLKFIGEVPDHRVGEVTGALSAIVARPFVVELEGVEASPARGAPSLVWMVVARPDPLLFQLRKAINDALIPVEIEPDNRAYRPHLTLARCEKSKRAAPAVRRWVNRHPDAVAPAFHAGSFDLVASKLDQCGARHEVLQTFRLEA